MELLLILAMSLLLIPLVALTSGPVRVLLGLFLVFFFPGYTFMAALFPKKDSISRIERFALSFGLSIVIVPLVGYLLNYTPWGIHLYPILVSLLIFIFITSFIAIYRRWHIPAGERFGLKFDQLRQLYNVLFRQSGRNKTLYIILILMIIGTVGTIGYTVTTIKKERFTEFYLLNLENKAENYPLIVRVGKENQVNLNIVNRESETTQYRVEVKMDGQKITEVEQIILNYREKWEQKVSFTARRVSQRQKVEFLLFKGNSSEPYRNLHIFVDVEN